MALPVTWESHFDINHQSSALPLSGPESCPCGPAASGSIYQKASRSPCVGWLCKQCQDVPAFSIKWALILFLKNMSRKQLGILKRVQNWKSEVGPRTKLAFYINNGHHELSPCHVKMPCYVSVLDLCICVCIFNSLIILYIIYIYIFISLLNSMR